MKEPMERHPRVSVVTPFFNAERFIEESVESVLAQTYADWELLLVDDGSTDRSTTIARNYASNDARVHYLAHENHENRGISATLNLGIRTSRAEYVAILDADDVWFAGKLEEQVAILDSNPDVDCVYGSILYWYSWAGDSGDREADHVVHPGFPSDTVVRPPDLLAANLKGIAPVPCPSSLLMRREAIVRVGGFVERFKRIFTDQAFYVKFFMESAVFVSDACWGKYRCREDSSVGTALAEGRLQAGHRDYLDWFTEYLDQLGRSEGELRRLVRKAMWPHQHPVLHRGIRAGRRLREAVAASFWNRAVQAALDASRLLLPHAIRQWLWTRWKDVRRSDSTTTPPGSER